MQPQEIADLLMNKDEKLQSQLVEMNRLQETMNSLNLINKKQQILNNSTTPSSYNTTNNNSEIATIASSISQLAMQIEERKNIIKNNLFNSFNSQLSTPVNFKIQQQYQHQQAQTHLQYLDNNQQRSNTNIFESNYKPHQTELPTHFLPSNQSNVRKINGNEPKEINLKSTISKNYLDSKLKENNELQDEDKVECENVFGAALKNKLDWQNQQQKQQYDLSSSNNSVSLLDPVDTSMLLQKFNYVSLLLDDYCDKNTSMNTKALAYKYLNKNDVTLNTNNLTLGNDMSSMYTASSYFINTPESNTTLISSTSTLPPFDSSKYEYNSNVPLFQYYTETNSVLLNPISPFKSGASDHTSSNNGSLNINHQQHFENKPQFNGSLNPNFCIKTYATSSSVADTAGSSNAQVHKCTGEYKENKNSNQENKEDDADSESETTKRKNNLYQQHGNEDQDDDEDDGEIWLFGKPNSNSTKMPSDQKKSQKAKQKQRNQRQQRRDNREKDFSDQDEPDRDVTTVLDIEKLKKLPKLL